MTARITSSGAIALGLLALSGCTMLGQQKPASGQQDPTRVSLRFHLASSTECEGYERSADEYGQPLWVATNAFLTEREVWTAAVFISAQRSLVRLEFTPLGAGTLERMTRAHVGGRLAVFIDNKFAMSPPVRAPLAGGKLYLDGGFSEERADEIARGLNAQRALFAPTAGGHKP